MRCRMSKIELIAKITYCVTTGLLDCVRVIMPLLHTGLLDCMRVEVSDQTRSKVFDTHQRLGG